MHNAIEDILDFWFGALDDRGLSPADRQAMWFDGSAATDTTIARRYGALLTTARAGHLEHWRQSDRGLVALIVLLDQFSRNIHRNTPSAFSADARALAIALQAIDELRDRRLPVIHRVFLYLPLEHSESLPVQERCVALLQQLASERGEPLQSFARYAVAHRDVIKRFGRFPHRNDILGRKSTPAERAYLQSHGGF